MFILFKQRPSGGITLVNEPFHDIGTPLQLVQRRVEERLADYVRRQEAGGDVRGYQPSEHTVWGDWYVLETAGFVKDPGELRDFFPPGQGRIHRIRVNEIKAPRAEYEVL